MVCDMEPTNNTGQHIRNGLNEYRRVVGEDRPTAENVYLSIKPMPAGTEPRQLPELRAAWLEACGGRAWNMHEHAKAIDAVLDFPDKTVGGTRFYDRSDMTVEQLGELMIEARQMAESQVDWHRRTIEAARLVWVSSEFVDVCESSAGSVPGDVVCDWEMTSAPSGLVVFGRPWYGTDVLTGAPLRVDAITWGPAIIEGTECLSVGMFRLVHPSQDDHVAEAVYEMADRSIPWWMPLGRTDWPLGQTLAEPLPGRDSLPGSMIEDRRMLCSVLSLIQQKRIVASGTAQADRASRKRIERKGYSVPDVTVIHLRSGEYKPTTSDGQGRHYKNRWIVGPHWRNQAYGPGHTKRKLILIAPYVKGPEGAPLKHAERVWAVDR